MNIPMPPRNTTAEVVARAAGKCLRLACAKSFPAIPIGDIAEVVSGGTPATERSEFWDGDVLWITPKDLGRPRSVEVGAAERSITQEGLESSSARLLPTGTVLLSSRAPIGHLGIAERPLATNQGFKNIICSKRMNNRFLFHILRGSIDKLVAEGRGNTFLEIPGKIVKAFSVPLPPIAVQESVARFLDALYLKLSDRKTDLPELPAPLAEQRRIVARIEEFAAKIAEARSLRESQESDLRGMLVSAFREITDQAPQRPFGEVAPLVRRAVSVSMEASYLELGIRSFGKGTFHKPALTGFELGNKRVFGIEAGDLLFTNVFAWEGAIAVAEPRDAGRFGSHRYITCVPKEGVATSRFLCFYFLTPDGLAKVGEASPGGAGRNRTLGLEALAKIEVPVPRIELQHWFDELQRKVDALKHLQAETASELDALLPSILDRAFKSEL